MIIQDAEHQNRVLQELGALIGEPGVERVRGVVAYATRRACERWAHCSRYWTIRFQSN